MFLLMIDRKFVFKLDFMICMSIRNNNVIRNEGKPA